MAIGKVFVLSYGGVNGSEFLVVLFSDEELSTVEAV